jgi:hypothetical protein
VTGTSERAFGPRLGAARPLQPGDPRRVGRYVLTGRLGAGGMGTVYLARAEGDGPPVAVKVVHPELDRDSAFRARFADEVAAARLVAPFCTARVVDADPSAHPPYLVTEFVDGVPLGTAVAEGGPLDPSTLHGVALGVAAALAAVHAAGVVHRDLKPANVLLSLSGPRVIDFGIARALDAAWQHTVTGMMVGTPGWMAPEQFRGGVVTPASDVFSWGSLIAYAATGRNPWEAAASPDGAVPQHPEVSAPPAELAYRIVHGSPNLTGLSGPLHRLVEASLAKDPARRPTARQLVDELLGDRGGTAAAAADPTMAATRFVERTWTGRSGPRGGPPQGVPVPPWAVPPQQSPGRGPAASGPGPDPRTIAAPAGSRGGGAAATRPAPATGFPPTPQPVSRPGRLRSAVTKLTERSGGSRVLPPTGRPVPSPPGRPPTPPPAPGRGTRTRRRRPWYRRKRLLLPVGLALLLVLLPNRPQPAVTPTGPQLGRPVRDGQLEFVVRSVRCGVTQLGSGTLASPAEGQYCLLRVEVTNVKDQPRRLYEPVQKLHDSAGDKHGAIFSARLYLPEQTLWDEVRPGESVGGTMVFDIPADRQAVALELHDGIASGGVTVRLR